MTEQPSRRAVLKAGAASAALAAIPAALGADTTVKDISTGLAKPLTPSNEKLATAALAEVKKGSVARLKHRLTENSEPSMVFEVRPGATTQW